MIGIDFSEIGWIGAPGHLRWGGGPLTRFFFGVGSASQLACLGKPQVPDAYGGASSFLGRLTSNQC